MNKSVKRWERYSIESLTRGETDASGRIFLSALGQVMMDGVHVVHSGLDTVKQLYSGVLNVDVLGAISDMYSAGFGECIELAGHVWLVGSGGKSGYQYRLQNSDLGLIVFLKSRYAEVAQEFSHVKIECSPHWLHSRDIKIMSSELAALAGVFLSGVQPAGCAVHLCADVQGWEPGQNFLDRLTTRARRLVSHKSARVLYVDMGEIATSYGEGQSYLLGSASSVQMAVYRKDIQAKAVDKMDFWRDIWMSAREYDYDKVIYRDSAPVWRVEFRFHHSVLADFGRGAASQMEYGFTVEQARWAHIAGVSQYLQGLWNYGLENFRLELHAEGVPRHFDPLWQFLLEDVRHSEPVGDAFYRRVKKMPGIGNEKNVMLAVGNLLSCYARSRFGVDYVMRCLKSCGIYDDLYNYMNNRAYRRQEIFSEDRIRQFVEKGLLTRKLLGRAA
ncbi:MAG: hypothetical protein LBR95_07500 [Azoarcus sp.]|jgi:hypothetical protein|nr:hypothetical protein [Azoarcus sp.]